MSKNNYMCILRGDCEEPTSPSEMEALFAKYKQWQDKFAGNILDMGAKLGQVGAVVRQNDLSDGPFIELKEVIGGYMTITADSLEEAIAVIKAGPMLANPGVSIEIREIATP